MKLSEAEKQMIEARRVREAEQEKHAEERQRMWSQEQERMDKGGLGCLFCAKTIREVRNEGRYEGNRRVDSMGWLVLTQWLGGGAMSEKEEGTLFRAELCCECLLRMVKKYQLSKEQFE